MRRGVAPWFRNIADRSALDGPLCFSLPMRPVVLLALAVSGCTSYQTVAIDAGADLDVSPRSYDAVRLTLGDGQTIAAESVHLDVDSTSWIDPATRAVRRVPTVEVAWVDQVRRRRGALQGAAISFAFTSVLSTFYHAVGNQNSLGGDIGRDAATGARHGLLVAPVGAAIGAVVGARDRSVFTVGPFYVGPEPARVPRRQ